MNDPFASLCHACGARGSFGPSAYEEPVSAPPVGRTRSLGSAARWAIAVAAVLIGGRALLLVVRLTRPRRPMFVQPVTLPTLAPTSPATSLAFAAKLPPARRFALTDDGRAIAFDGNRLQAYTSAGTVTGITGASGSFAPRENTPIFVVDDVAYWIGSDETDIVGVRLSPEAKPFVVVKDAQGIGGLSADAKSIWYTASDRKGRALMRTDVTAKKVTPIAVATWTSPLTTETLATDETSVFVTQPAEGGALRVVRVQKNGGKPTTVVTLAVQEDIGALAASETTLYFTIGANDLYRVPLAGGDRTKVMSQTGGIGDVVVADKDVVVADRPNTAWQIESLPDGDVTQITIVASDVGRQPRLHASPGHVAWSTDKGVSFADL